MFGLGCKEPHVTGLDSRASLRENTEEEGKSGVQGAGGEQGEQVCGARRNVTLEERCTDVQAGALGLTRERKAEDDRAKLEMEERVWEKRTKSAVDREARSQGRHKLQRC